MPERGYPLLTVPKVPLPRRPSGRPAPPARQPARGRGRAPSGPSTESGAAGRRRLRRLRLHARPTSPPAGAAIPIVVHEQNARAGVANRARRPADPVRRDDVRRHHSCAHAMRHRHAAAPRDRPARPRPPRRAEALAALRPRPGLADRCWSPAGRSARSGSTRPSGRRVAALLAAGVQVLHLTGAGKDVRGPPTTAAPARPTSSRPTPTGWTSPMPPPTSWSCRAGASTVCELTAVGLPAVYVPLPIGNGEQRLNAADVVAAGGGLLVDDAALTPAWIARTLRAAGRRTATAWTPWRPPRPRRGCAAPTSGSPTWSPRPTRIRLRGNDERLQRPLRLHRPDPCRWRSSARSTSSPSAAPACPGSRGSCWPAGCAVSGSDAKESPVLAALAAEGADVHVGHDAAYVEGKDTVVVSSAIRESNIELARARAAGLRVLHRSQALASTMAGLAPGRGRRRQRQDHDDLDAHRRAAALRHRPVVRGRRRAGRARHQRPLGHRRGVRGGGRRERRLVPRLPPRGRGRHQRPARPPRLLRHLRGGRGGLHRVRRDASVDGGLLVACADDEGSRGSPRRPGLRAPGCSPTAGRPTPTWSCGTRCSAA